MSDYGSIVAHGPGAPFVGPCNHTHISGGIQVECGLPESFVPIALTYPVILALKKGLTVINHTWFLGVVRSGKIF